MALRSDNNLDAWADGAGQLDRVYHGDELVWPVVTTFSPLRMDKSGSYAAPKNSLTKVTGWEPGTGTTSADIINDELVVNGDGSITVSVQLTRSSNDSTSSNIRLYRNGVQVQASATFGFTNTQSLSWTGDVAAGDTLAAYYYAQNYFNGTNITAGYLGYTLA